MGPPAAAEGRPPSRGGFESREEGIVGDLVCRFMAVQGRVAGVFQASLPRTGQVTPDQMISHPQPLVGSAHRKMDP